MSTYLSLFLPLAIVRPVVQSLRVIAPFLFLRCTHIASMDEHSSMSSLSAALIFYPITNASPPPLLRLYLYHTWNILLPVPSLSQTTLHNGHNSPQWLHNAFPCTLWCMWHLNLNLKVPCTDSDSSHPLHDDVLKYRETLCFACSLGKP